ncbi:MAG: hypothetical protein KC547_01860, partial [Anaerolineae bacterium]|nr:hypothetical protein [Anaerolineae bacterium]
IWGYCKDESLGDKVRITIIATGFQTNPDTGTIATERNTRTVIPLGADMPTMITQPIVNPVLTNAPAASVAPPEADTDPTEPYLKPIEAKVEPVQPPAAPQRTFEFEPARRPSEPEKKEGSSQTATEKKRFSLYDDEDRTETANTSDDAPQPEVNEARLSQAEHQQRVEQRVSKVRELNQRLRTPNGLSDLEREPAYKRKNIQLNDSTASTDSNISRYTLNEETDENGERRVELKRNNPYLHDNVD